MAACSSPSLTLHATRGAVTTSKAGRLQLIDAIDLSVWEAVFAVCGRPQELPPTFDHDDLAAAMLGPRPAALNAALVFIDELGDDRGIDALLTNAAELGVALPFNKDDSGAGTVATFYLTLLKDPSWAPVVERAQLALRALAAPVLAYVFVGRIPRPWANEPARLQSFEADARGVLEGRHHGENVEVRCVANTDGVQLVISRGSRLKKSSVWEEAKRTRRTQRFVHDDRIFFDGATNRLHISTGRSVTLVHEYRRLVGQAFFDDEQHFRDDQDRFFDVLAAKGRVALDAAVDEETGGCRLQELTAHVDGTLLTLRGKDALAGAERLRIDLAASHVTGARLQLGGSKGIRVIVKRGRGTALSVLPRAAQRVAQGFLARVAAQHVVVDLTLWHLSGSPQPAQRWRDHLGDDIHVKALVAAGALAPQELAVVVKGGFVHDVVKHAGVAVGVPASEAGLPAASPTPSELAAYALNPLLLSDLLLREATPRLGIKATQRKHIADVGTVFIGTFSSSDGSDTFGVAIQYAGPHGQAAVAVAEEALKAGATRTALLVPPGCTGVGATNVVLVNLDRWDSFNGVVRQIARSLGIRDALLLATPGMQLIVDLNQRRLWWRERELTPSFSDREWRLLAALARAEDRRLLHEALAEKLVADAEDDEDPDDDDDGDDAVVPSSLTKATVGSFKKKLANHMSSGSGFDPEIRGMIKSISGGYRLVPTTFCEGEVS